MLTRRSILLLLPSAALAWDLTDRLAYGEDEVTPGPWQGEDEGRISSDQQAALEATLRTFCGQSKADLVPGVGPLLFDQFAAVGLMMEEYSLPSGRLILDHYNARFGTNAVVVPNDTSMSEIVAAAMLTHLCPKAGVEENVVSSNGTSYKEHFSCQLDCSLIIFYQNGSAPNPTLNAEISRWAKASIATRIQWVRRERKSLLKRFVRVLD